MPGDECLRKPGTDLKWTFGVTMSIPSARGGDMHIKPPTQDSSSTLHSVSNAQNSLKTIVYLGYVQKDRSIPRMSAEIRKRH